MSYKGVKLVAETNTGRRLYFDEQGHSILNFDLIDFTTCRFEIGNIDEEIRGALAPVAINFNSALDDMKKEYQDELQSAKGNDVDEPPSYVLTEFAKEILLDQCVTGKEFPLVYEQGLLDRVIRFESQIDDKCYKNEEPTISDFEELLGNSVKILSVDESHS